MWVPTGAFSRFRPHRRGNVGAISAATFVSHPEAGDDGRRLPARRALTRPGRDVLVNAPAVFPVRSADRGTDARSTSLLVNRLAVFPVRPADRGTDARSRRLLVNAPAVFPVRPADGGTAARPRRLLVNRPAVFPVRPADGGTDARSGRLLVNAPAVFPVRPADGGGAHGDVSGPRDPSWPLFWRSRRRFAAHSAPPPKSLYLPPLFRAFRSFRGPHPTAGHFTRCAGPISRSLLEAVSSGSRFTTEEKGTSLILVSGISDNQ